MSYLFLCTYGNLFLILSFSIFSKYQVNVCHLEFDSESLNSFIHFIFDAIWTAIIVFLFIFAFFCPIKSFCSMCTGSNYGGPEGSKRKNKF